MMDLGFRFRLTTENHKRDQPGGTLGPSHLLASVIGQWNTESTECSVEDSHEGVVDLWWVGVSRLEFERTVVTSEVSRETDQHLSERRMDIKVEFTFEVVRTELSETEAIVSLPSLQPGNLQSPQTSRATYWASSQVTMLDCPILYNLVKKARKVKTSGAMTDS
jgi:hypothetical protein